MSQAPDHLSSTSPRPRRPSIKHEPPPAASSSPSSHLATSSIIDDLLPRWLPSRTQRPSAHPSLYHNSSRSPSAPLFSRKIDWLPSPNVLHYVPVSLSDQSDHLTLFTQWQKDPRVAAWWNQALSEEEQRKLLTQCQHNSDTLGLIGYWSHSESHFGQPWGYVEIYWAKTSSIGDFYDYPPFTLGFHALVGEEKFRGPDRVRAWMGSAIHMAFTLEERCELVVSEPNIKNQKMVDYECECGGVVEKPVELPHKIAALVFFRRETFSKLWPIGPRKASRRE